MIMGGIRIMGILTDTLITISTTIIMTTSMIIIINMITKIMIMKTKRNTHILIKLNLLIKKRANKYMSIMIKRIQTTKAPLLLHLMTNTILSKHLKKMLQMYLI